MAYGTRAGMEAVFGTQRIAKLADWDETQVSATITANINTALAYADDRINARMRLTHHRIPLATSAGATPGMVSSIANRIAGGYLARQWRLESVPPGDAGERVLQYEQEALGELDMIANGMLRIDAV
jgi:phage gp36-like protein